MTSSTQPSRLELPPRSSTAVLVLCDAPPEWATAWRRELTSPPTTIVAVHLPDVWTNLQTYPHGVLALAWRQQAAPQQVELLARVQAELPHVLCVAMLSPAQAAWEMLLREAGVHCVISSPREVLQAAPLVRRHLARAPLPKLSFRELVWQRLPWDAVTATGDLP